MVFIVEGNVFENLVPGIQREVKFNARDRKNGYDTTSLDVLDALGRGFVHRDWIAHFMRFQYVVKKLLHSKQDTSMNILDVGCGEHMYLPQVIKTNRVNCNSYVGVDMGRQVTDKKKVRWEKYQALTKGTSRIDFNILFEIDFTKDVKLFDDDLYQVTSPVFGECLFNRPSLITSFEVAEHMPVLQAFKMLEKMYELLIPGGVVMISTPCFNRAHAANHINEMTYGFFGWMLERAGFQIENATGTFCKKVDLRNGIRHRFPSNEANFIIDNMIECDSHLHAELPSVILAVDYPAWSRNVMWTLRKPITFSPIQDRIRRNEIGQEVFFPELPTDWAERPYVLGQCNADDYAEVIHYAGEYDMRMRPQISKV